MVSCRCDNNQCSTCACAKAKINCTSECHWKKDWKNVPCLNTDLGKTVKVMSIKDVRTALCANSLSPVGDKSELQKRLAIFFEEEQFAKAKTPIEDTSKEPSTATSSTNNKHLFQTIAESEGDHAFILSLSGRTITKSSSKPELRKAYLLLSTKVHPDKNGNSKESVQAFQILLSAFERLANPEKFEENEGKPARKRQKTEYFTRSNNGCFKTKIQCPQCKQTWGGNELGLEEGAYNFFMMAIKQYICGRCSCEFGCMTAIHYCPKCSKTFDYDPEDYHRQITCGNGKCSKKFGFMMFKVSERREKEVRAEAKSNHERYLKRITQKNRRAARADRRTVKDDVGEERLQEKLFLIGLRDECPRCGWELQHGQGSDEANEHLKGCNDSSAIEMYKKQQEEKTSLKAEKVQKQENQAEMMAIKQWEHNGRQVGQIWMLSDAMLEKMCRDSDLSCKGKRYQLIARLSKYLRSRQPLMITDGKKKSETVEVMFDTSTLMEADDDDLPSNVHTMERDELQELCASYSLKFNVKKDTKSDLIKIFEAARLKGRNHLMITDNKAESISE